MDHNDFCKLSTYAYRYIVTIIIINQFVTRQMPVSQILRLGRRYATSQFGLIVKSKCNIEQICL